jgi:hypothetical protein
MTRYAYVIESAGGKHEAPGYCSINLNARSLFTLPSYRILHRANRLTNKSYRPGLGRVQGNNERRPEHAECKTQNYFRY